MSYETQIAQQAPRFNNLGQKIIFANRQEINDCLIAYQLRKIAAKKALELQHAKNFFLATGLWPILTPLKHGPEVISAARISFNPKAANNPKAPAKKVVFHSFREMAEALLAKGEDNATL